MQKNVVVVDHPLIQHKLSLLRNKKTNTKDFKELVTEITMLMGFVMTGDLPLQEVEVETPLAIARTKMIAGKKLGIVAILRAGLGMVEGLTLLMPFSKVGHIGLYRNHETLQPVQYYCKLPADVHERDVVIIDPMLATGGSASAAVKLVKEQGAKSIRLMCLVAVREGIDRVYADHPDVKVYCAAVDPVLNEHGYIVPGLGDAGDRLFGTL
jgi:uracil phosphoribosyltransferase